MLFTLKTKKACNIIFILIVSIGFVSSFFPSVVLAQECLGPADIELYNGNILTMDARDTTVRAVRIIGDKIVKVGNAASSEDPCTRKIDLKGLTVIPGMIDTHTHIVYGGLRPGHEMREMENVTSIADVIATIREKAKSVPRGEWITVISGWTPEQLDENRPPTLRELDKAAANHPVFIQWNSFFGPSVTNSLGREFLERQGVDVADNGIMARIEPTFAAYRAIDALDTFEDKKQTTRDVLQYSASVGLTTVFETGGGHNKEFNPPARYLDPIRGYDPMVELWREGKLDIRIRLLHSTEDGADLTTLRARLDNAFQGFGDDWLRVAGFGEHFLTYPPSSYRDLPPGAFPTFEAAEEGYEDWYYEGSRLMAKHGWTQTQHSLADSENEAHLDAWEKVNREYPIADLRWSLAHVWFMTQKSMDRLKALGAGVTTNGPYLRGAPTPYRSAIETGLEIAAGTDSPSVSPINPWLNIYYMVTGRMAGGKATNLDETIGMMDALRLYTRNGGWHSREEDKLGTIEVGKLGDLVVLNKNPLEVSGDEIKTIRSRLTIIGGKIAYSDGTLAN